MGILGAEIGLASCAAFPPAMPVCGFVGGVIGSVSGYNAGSAVATKIYDINPESFQKVSQQPIHDSIEKTRIKYSEWQPTTFFGKLNKVLMEQELDALELERYEIDAGIAVFESFLK
jgi:hypothetical protein